MDDTAQIIAIGLIVILGPPIGMKIRRMLGFGKKKIKVVVTCPHCGADIDLEKLRNYICAECKGTVAFFNLRTGQPHETARFVDCPRCREKTFKGPHNCQHCGADITGLED